MILDNFEKNLFFAHVLPKFRLSRGSCPYNSETLQLELLYIRQSFHSNIFSFKYVVENSATVLDLDDGHFVADV